MLTASLLYRLEPTDPLTFGVTIAVLLTAEPFAGFIPLSVHRASTHYGATGELTITRHPTPDAAGPIGDILHGVERSYL